MATTVGRRTCKEHLVEWWGWLIVVVGVVVILVGLFVGLQARRRRGGVIVAPSPGPGDSGPQGSGSQGSGPRGSGPGSTP